MQNFIYVYFANINYAFPASKYFRFYINVSDQIKLYKILYICSHR